MSNNQSIVDFNKYISTLLMKYLLDKRNINMATYNKVREKSKNISKREEVA